MKLCFITPSILLTDDDQETAYLLAMLLLTVRRKRPLARRREITLRPSAVDILSRKPCLFTLFLLEG